LRGRALGPNQEFIDLLCPGTRVRSAGPTASGSRASFRAQMDSGASHPAQHAPTFVPGLLKPPSQLFEVPNSLLSHTVRGRVRL